MASDWSGDETVTNKDIQGVLRGRCKQCSNCQQFCQPASGPRCAVCTHAPAQHVRLDEDGIEVATSPTINSSTTSSYTSTTTGTVASHQLQYPPLPHLPKCKSEACPNPVYCDPYFGQFDYCSPACRNEHLLEREQKRLKDDVMDGIKKLRELQPPLSAESTSTDSGRKSKIVITKSPGQALGIIFGPYELVVTGVTNRSPAYQHLKDGNLKLLSMVTSVCGTDVGELTESFDDHVLPMASVELGLDMSRALSVDHFPDDSFDHVFALQPVNSKKFGISLDDAVEVQEVMKNSPAELTGIQKGDMIVGLIAGNEKILEILDQRKAKHVLSKAFSQHTAVVVFIRRVVTSEV